MISNGRYLLIRYGLQGRLTLMDGNITLLDKIVENGRTFYGDFYLLENGPHKLMLPSAWIKNGLFVPMAPDQANPFYTAADFMQMYSWLITDNITPMVTAMGVFCREHDRKYAKELMASAVCLGQKLPLYLYTEEQLLNGEPIWGNDIVITPELIEYIRVTYQNSNNG